MPEKQNIQLKQIDNQRWEISQDSIPGMKVPGMIYATHDLMREIESDQSAHQVANVACLPGILGVSLAMPDIHWGYGFPIGGVAATDIETGVISPGGVGYDISCGVRMVRTNLNIEQITPVISDLINTLYRNIPCGVGSSGVIDLNAKEMSQVLRRGVPWVVEQGFGVAEDIEFHEENGCLKSADDEEVSTTAKQRGKDQLGTLGSGNHFLEIQVVDEIFDEHVANVFGVFKGQVVVMLHSGSRGLGYQVCDDYLAIMKHALPKYGIELPDNQLACVPIKSKEGQSYLKAMAAAANYGMANRQMMTHLMRETFMQTLKIGPTELGMDLIYDVCHNIAKLEEHMINGKMKTVCVHRKGATRAFPAGHPQVPLRYRSVGQPVLVPGDMGRCSYLLVGLPGAMEQTFGSTCHGAGRQMSRTQALKTTKGRRIDVELEERGIYVRSRGRSTLNEESSEAYKDVSKVVDVCEQAGISKRVARLKPLGCIKG